MLRTCTVGMEVLHIVQSEEGQRYGKSGYSRGDTSCVSPEEHIHPIVILTQTLRHKEMWCSVLSPRGDNVA